MSTPIRSSRRLSALVALAAAAFALALAGLASSAQAADSSYPASFSSLGCPNHNWQYVRDSRGFNNEYVLSSGSQPCANGDWYVTGAPSRQTCDWWLFVPSAFGNARVFPGVFTPSGKRFGNTIDENSYTDQFAYIGKFSRVSRVNIGSNNGQTETYIGLGTDNSLLATNCR